MTAHYHGQRALSEDNSIEMTVQNLIDDLKKKRPEAEVVGVQVFLDGMGAHGFEITVEGKKLSVNFVATSEEYAPGLVRLVFGEGIFESYPSHQRSEAVSDTLTDQFG